MWLCGKRGLKEDLGDFMGFNKFVIWSWNGKFFLGKVCWVTIDKRE
jgi:hypothetical protein